MVNRAAKCVLRRGKRIICTRRGKGKPGEAGPLIRAEDDSGKNFEGRRVRETGKSWKSIFAQRESKQQEIYFLPRELTRLLGGTNFPRRCGPPHPRRVSLWVKGLTPPLTVTRVLVPFAVRDDVLRLLLDTDHDEQS